jgi:ribosomal protein S18 acetylase RimI-like enzyme
MSDVAFARERYQIALDGGALLLDPPDRASAAAVAPAICAMDPWLTLGMPPDRMAAFLVKEDAHCYRKLMRYGDELAGVVAVRSPWLNGPYLNLLAVFPLFQGLGIGSAIIGWMESEMAGGAGNVWLCASEFNARAIAFYERHGFMRVAHLTDLVTPGFAELLMRKQLDRAPHRA